MIVNLVAIHLKICFITVAMKSDLYPTDCSKSVDYSLLKQIADSAHFSPFQGKLQQLPTIDTNHTAISITFLIE